MPRSSNVELAPVDNITIKNAQFVYRTNFEGREEEYNEPGNRYFNVRVPDNILQQVIADGWPVKYTKPRKNASPDEVAEFQPVPYMEVKIGFTYRPPTLVLIEDGVQTQLTEQTAGLLDTLQFENVDVVLRGRPWEAAFGRGIKPYLQTLAATIEMDEIQRMLFQQRNNG